MSRAPSRATPNAKLLETCLAFWKWGQRPGATLADQIKVDKKLARYESLWTAEERLRIKTATANFRAAKS